MATATQAPVNGNYPVQQTYVDAYSHAQAAVNNNAASFQQTQSATPSNAPPSEQENDISKDEVGWYFVEQYYTTMSRSPEKLHLFYSRRSQLVFGTEAETVPVVVGQKVSQRFPRPSPLKGLPFADKYCCFFRLSMRRLGSWTSMTAKSVSSMSILRPPSRIF